MIQFRILLTIALLSFTSQSFSTTVSGEIGSKNAVKKSVTIVTELKKPVQKVSVRKISRTVSYMSPAGKESISVEVRVKDGIILSTSVIPRSTNKISKSLQQAFAKKIGKAVIGKKAKNLDIDVVGGASLTTAAFEQYVQKSFK